MLLGCIIYDIIPTKIWFSIFCSVSLLDLEWGLIGVVHTQQRTVFKVLLLGIMAKKLVPIIFTYIVWGPYLSKHQINFQCDNANLIIGVNKGSSKDKFVMHLLRSLSFFVAHFDISHLPGLINVTADHLSHGNMCQAFKVTPSLIQHPAIIPSSAFKLISPHILDWISHGFLQLFQITLSSI